MIIKVINTPQETITIIIGTKVERENYAPFVDEGRLIWYDTTDKTFYLWDGSNWR